MYEAVTPPAFARMSGITKMFLSARMSSATAVVGPLAPSAMILALILSALRLVITFSVAAGIRMSQSVIRRSLVAADSAPLNPVMVPLR